MAKIPEHIATMLERCKEDPKLVLTASCGCEVGSVSYRGEVMPYVDVCRNHKDELLEATRPWSEGGAKVRPEDWN